MPSPRWRFKPNRSRASGTGSGRGPANRFGEIRDNVEEVGVSELKVRFRAGMDAGNWQREGDRFFEALATNERPVVLAIDELSILVNRLLKGHDFRVTPERRAATDRFMSWLRRNCQAHSGQVCLIISGSVGLGPILRQAGLSAQANVFVPLDLPPWSREVSMECLAALARGQGISLSEGGARRDLPAAALLRSPPPSAIFPPPP